jgi:hypothetical protein
MVQPYPNLPPPEGLPRNFSDVLKYFRRIYEVIAPMRQGKLECVRGVLLTANVGSTTITDPRITVQSCCCLSPTTANAAAAIATTYLVPSNGSVLITHANNAQTDRLFFMAIIG